MRAERLLITARVTGATVTTTSLAVNVETSNDDVNWYPGTTLVPSTPIDLDDPLVWWETGETAVMGRFVRVSATLGGSSVVGGYVEIWVCGRSFY